MKTGLKILLFITLLALPVIYYVSKHRFDGEEKKEIVKQEIREEQLIELYGIDISSFRIKEGQILRNQTLGSILDGYGVTAAQTEDIVRSSENIFDVRKIMAGKDYYVLCTDDSSETPACFVYHRSEIEKVIFNISDSVFTRIFTQTPDTVRRYFEGEIELSLYQTIIDKGAPIELAMALADIYAWEIDFFKIQKNDAFKVVYNELVIDDKSIGVDKIIACDFTNMGNSYKAYYFAQPEGHSYFNEKGESLQKAFLKAPLNYSRISSRYSRRRFHPVQKRFKAHLGTDYAAPTGTPIMSVGDGAIIAAAYTAGNGNYVKVKHNATYSTQYLHMSKIANGIKKGVRVKQGQVIGYVGSTGLATGPHLCFRFWKNGEQVDALKVKLPPSKPLDPMYMEEFRKAVNKLDLYFESPSSPS